MFKLKGAFQMKLTAFIVTFTSLICFSFYSYANEQTNEHAEHKPRHGANLNLLPPPPVDASKSTRPESVTIESPAPMAKVTGTSVQLKWSNVKSANQYRLQVATDAAFKWIFVDEKNLSNTEFNLTGLEAGKQYFWRVYSLRTTNDPGYLKGNVANSSFEVK